MKYQSFSKRQLLAMTWWNRPGLKNRDGILCDGAIRSGKTLSMVTGFFLWSMASQRILKCEKINNRKEDENIFFPVFSCYNNYVRGFPRHM